jgi:AcrR family transcriptional regulator
MRFMGLERGPRLLPVLRSPETGVVRRALELLNEGGFDGLTMRRLAEKLGIKAASLYNYVKDKDELLALMANAICAEIPDLDHSRPWREQAERMALQVRTVLMVHRDGARVLAATPPVGPHRLRLIEQLLHALVGAGLSRARVVDAAFVINSYVVASCSMRRSAIRQTRRR